MNGSEQRRNSAGTINDRPSAAVGVEEVDRISSNTSVNAEADKQNLPPLDGILQLPPEILVEFKARVTRSKRMVRKKTATNSADGTGTSLATVRTGVASRVAVSDTARTLFLLGGTVSTAAAEKLVGASLLRTLADAGLLEVGSSGVRCLFRVAIFGDLLILEDGGADIDIGQAMKASGRAWEAFRGLLSSEARFANALNLLAGTGAIALWLAGISGQVLAVANNSRSLMLCRINSAINGVKNIEFHDDVSIIQEASDKYDLITIDETEYTQSYISHDGDHSGGHGIDADEHFKQLAHCLRPSGRAIITFESYGEFARRGYGMFRDAENFKTILFLQQASADSVERYEILADFPATQSTWVPSEKLAATLVVEASAPDEGWHGVVPLTGGPWEGLSPMLIDTLFL